MLKKIGFVLSVLLGHAAFAQGSIEAVSGSVQGGSEVVRIDLSQALTSLPTGFAIQSPARIAFGIFPAYPTRWVVLRSKSTKGISNC